MRLRTVRESVHYGGLIATARNTVLKTVGTASTRMGIDTSALRQRLARRHNSDCPKMRVIT